MFCLIKSLYKVKDEYCRDGINEDLLTVWPKPIAEFYAGVLLSYSQEIMEKNGEG